MEPDTNTQPIPPTIQQAPVQTQMPEKHNSPILLWLLILALVGVASYFGYQYWQLKQQMSRVRPTPTPRTTPTTTPDLTANWKTYIYEKYGYSFKYPSEYTVEEKTPGFLVIAASGEHIAQAGISIESRLTGPYANYVNAKNIITSTNILSEAKTLGKWEIFQGIGKDGMLKGVEFRFGIAPYNTGAIEAETLANTQYVKVFDQILSTFTFTNAKSEIPNNINKIFTAVNQAFGSNITPTKESQFYSLKGFVSKESWKLDLSSLLTEKSQFTKLFNLLNTLLKQDINSTADGVGQSVQGYENNQVYCFLLQGFNQSDYISCVEK